MCLRNNLYCNYCSLNELLSPWYYTIFSTLYLVILPYPVISGLNQKAESWFMRFVNYTANALCGEETYVKEFPKEYVMKP